MIFPKLIAKFLEVSYLFQLNAHLNDGFSTLPKKSLKKIVL